VQAGDVIVRVDPRYFRPTEVQSLLGDPSKATGQAELEGPDQLRRTGQRDGGKRLHQRQARQRWSSWPAFRPTTTTSESNEADSRIYIAGHRGLVGSAIVRRLQAAGHASSSHARTPSWT
jgi:hypothetical protein